MGLKDAETAVVADWAVQGWLAYVLETGKELAENAPVQLLWDTAAMEDRQLPAWLRQAVWARLVTRRGEILVARVTSWARQSG